jgi:putative peptide zinc metalloprotease protein
MAQLRLGYPEIRQRGAEVLQVTHSAPEEARVYFQQYQLGFPYLCDADRRVHELYGIHMVHPGVVEGVRNLMVCSAATVGDRVLRGEKSPSPAPYFKRQGFSKDSPQAVFIVDRDGIIRYVYTAAPIGAMPSNADLLRQLAVLR